MQRDGLDLGAGHRHVKRGRDAFARNVADDHAEMIVIDEEEIEEVAADGFGRSHLGVDVEVGALGERRERARDQRVLDDARGIELFLNGGELLAVANRVHHFRAEDASSRSRPRSAARWC